MTQSFVVAEHASEGRLILAVCDLAIHGKRFEEGDRLLDLSSHFYKGNQRDEPAVTNLMLKAYMIHVIGKDAVEIAVKLGLASKNDALTVQGVPHIEILLL